MIEFIQDYTTKALPPEKFEDGQQVERSIESELYFVRLGVAGYVVGGELVDQDYQPLARRTAVVEVVSPGDRRFADSGRGGEQLGLNAPQRASTGPGNAAVFGTMDVGGDLRQVEVDQLTADLAASVQQLEEHRGSTTTQIDQLTDDLTAAQGAREAALADLATAQADRDQARGDLSTAQAERDEARADREKARSERELIGGRVAELEAELADAKAAAKPAKAK